MSEKIHVAYGVSRKGGVTSFRARAYVVRNRIKHSFRVAIGDSAQEAIDGVLAYLHETYQRDGLEFPGEIIQHGKKAGPFLDNWHFGEGF